MSGFSILFLISLLVGLYLALKETFDSNRKDLALPDTTGSGGAAGIMKLADIVEPVIQKSAHPSEVLDNADFEKAVVDLASSDYTIQQVNNYALGANWVLTCIGYEALARRDDSAETVDRVLKVIKNTYAWPLFFLMRFIDAKASEPACARILTSAQSWWPENPATVEFMTSYLEQKVAAGEDIVFGQLYTDLEADDKQSVHKFIEALPGDLRTHLNARLEQFEREAIDKTFLLSVGEILDRNQVSDPVFNTAQISQLRSELQDELDSLEPRSILVVGGSGVGKSALTRAFANDLLDKGWAFFQTSAAALIADKKYVGEIEGQVRQLAKNAIVKKRVAMYVERMSDLSQMGRYSGKESSILDQLWPDIESRKVFLISETTESGLQALIRSNPSLPTVMKVMTMQSLAEGETAELATRLLEYLEPDLADKQADEVVSESLQMAQQYLSHKSMPGSVLSLLELAVMRARRDADGDAVGRDHVLGAVSQISGLPREVLDDKQKLDIIAVSREFKQRVIGQDEAVDCLVERIAMLKAGLTDPTRPIGVFLFAGPTGTGKTEIAKSLAELLFGSPEQMIRLDMSEYQDPDSVWRIIGQNKESIASGSLVNRIRERPFSVVLLDEFEKAHSKVWDIFLQVFDDGRLSDSHGESADFRHAIIILTSNLGATISNEAGVGFTSTSGGFSAKDVMRTVNRTFRREFINRLDRVVVFRPLNREVMRAILYNELEKALERRGLRTKQWAVEWEDSAIEYLLSEGFTPDLGARPLRRAIERHLLAPLSITMVQNQAPAGEQFLFVRSNGEALQVEFIDPDADSTEVDADIVPTTGKATDIDLPGLILCTSVPSNAAEYLAGEMTAVAERVGNDEWIDTKSAQIEELNEDGFWERDDRYTILDRIELIDRLDSAANVLGSLSGRLQQHPGNVKLIKSIANRLYVLQEGLQDLDLERATQAYLGVRLVSSDAELSGAAEFLQNVVDMYQNWARARGMRLREIEASNSRYDSLFMVSGFGSYGVLHPESGLHVFETPKSETRFDRLRVRVEVAAVPAEAPGKYVTRGSKATGVLDAAAGKVEIVRRYRRQPSPLARDSVRGWRSGKLERVFGGDFDVLS